MLAPMNGISSLLTVVIIMGKSCIPQCFSNYIKLLPTNKHAPVQNVDCNPLLTTRVLISILGIL